MTQTPPRWPTPGGLLRKVTEPVWKVEKRYGLPKGSLEGKGQSGERDGSRGARGRRDEPEPSGRRQDQRPDGVLPSLVEDGGWGATVWSEHLATRRPGSRRGRLRLHCGRRERTLPTQRAQRESAAVGRPVGAANVRVAGPLLAGRQVAVLHPRLLPQAPFGLADRSAGSGYRRTVVHEHLHVADRWPRLDVQPQHRGRAGSRRQARRRSAQERRRNDHPQAPADPQGHQQHGQLPEAA